MCRARDELLSDLAMCVIHAHRCLAERSCVCVPPCVLTVCCMCLLFVRCGVTIETHLGSHARIQHSQQQHDHLCTSYDTRIQDAERIIKIYQANTREMTRNSNETCGIM